MNNDLLMTIRQIMDQTELPQEVFIEAIEAALYAAAKRRYGSTRGVSIKIDPDLGEIKCYVPKKVVEIMHHFAKEIPIEEALKINPDVRLDEIIEVEVNPREFGRIEAQTARQILVQKIKEAEREQIYQEYKEREGEIITGYFQRIERGNIILDLERTEGLLPFSEVLHPHDYRRGDVLRCLVLQVQVNPKGPQIVLSRTHPGLIARLFEMEVPEIYDGLVRIMAIARDPGERAKVAVAATDESIDAVGTCVGVKGSRVQTVVRELEGEKIDLLEWNPDPAIFIANALQPATVVRVNIDEENESAVVVVPDDQLSLAIGRRGQNARLAARLTGWKIDIKSESETETQFKEEIAEELFKSAPSETADDSPQPTSESDGDETVQASPRPHADEIELTELTNVGPKTAELLREAGFSTVASIAQATVEELASAPGIGAKTAEKIHHAAQEMFSASET
ncbi:MAG: transcription termination factor NusA [Candidatus Poribacteria bacterium]|nr:transcription termination factor NusA [Candidatus Poribacteria bacterium]